MKFVALLLLGFVTVEGKKLRHHHHHKSQDWDKDGEEAMNVKDYTDDVPAGYDLPMKMEKKAVTKKGKKKRGKKRGKKSALT
jgi:hypothetical protein